MISSQIVGATASMSSLSHSAKVKAKLRVARDEADPPAPKSLTAANLKVHDPAPTRAEQEEELLKKMQTLSELLGQVDAALDSASTSVPTTAGSQRPPPTGGSARPQSQRGVASAAGAPTPGSARPPASGASACSSSSRSVRGGNVPEAPQLAVIHDDAPLEEAPVKMVQYTGHQHDLSGIKSRRRVDARAARSDIGSVLGWSAP